MPATAHMLSWRAGSPGPEADAAVLRSVPRLGHRSRGTALLHPPVARREALPVGRDLRRRDAVDLRQDVRLAAGSRRCQGRRPLGDKRYLGKNAQFDQAMGKFALAYADQAERDHAALRIRRSRRCCRGAAGALKTVEGNREPGEAADYRYEERSAVTQPALTPMPRPSPILWSKRVGATAGIAAEMRAKVAPRPTPPEPALASAKIRPTRAAPKVCPTSRAVARMPLALPARSRGALARMVRLLGIGRSRTRRRRSPSTRRLAIPPRALPGKPPERGPGSTRPNQSRRECRPDSAGRRAIPR